jgi:hypothetical protein
MSLNTARRLESGNLMTPKGRMLYPALFKPQLPRGETDEKKAKYQVTLLLPKGSDIAALKAAENEAIEEKVTPKMRATTKIKSPFLKTADQPRFAEYADDYPVMLRFNATLRPDVVTPKGDRAVTEDEAADEVYSGRWARVTCRAFFYDHPTGGKGVSLGLQNVQLLDHADPMAGGRVRGTAEFEAVEGDALADMEV